MAHRREVGKPLWKSHDLAAFGDDVRQTACDRHHCQGRDEGRQLRPGNEKPVNETAGGSDQKARNDSQPERHSDRLVEPAHHHHGKGKNRSHGEIDSADDNDCGHADRKNPQDGNLIDRSAHCAM